jgi:predicted CXXCH cytochrome family protein
MRSWIWIAIAVAGVALAPATASADELSPEAKRGRAAMKQAECTRCHSVTDSAGAGRGLAAAPTRSHCVGCHTWILGTKDDPDAIARNRKVYPDWDRYLVNITHFTALPDLGTLTRRVKPSFVRAYLDGPTDLRPHLDESMISVKLSDDQKDDVVAYLSELNGAKDDAKIAKARSAKRVAQGRKLFERRGCASCHLIGDLDFGKDYDAAFYAGMKPVALLAPDLRHAKRRMTRESLVRFIEDPQSVDATASMTKPELEAGDAERIADFLLGVEAAAAASADPVSAKDVPVLDRKVSYEEVSDRVLGRICVHCHMNADNNSGDGGPGNTGGLGWKGAGLDLETYAGAKLGVLRDGKRVSILDAGDDGEPPLLLQSLLRRHDEVAGTVGERPGMPMALPPLDVGDLSLIKSWLDQGAPGPRD